MKYCKALGLPIQWKPSQGPATPLSLRRLCLPHWFSGFLQTAASFSSCHWLHKESQCPKRTTVAALAVEAQVGAQKWAPWNWWRRYSKFPGNPSPCGTMALPQAPPKRSTGCKPQALPQSTVGSAACSQELGRAQRHTAHHRESCDENGMETGVFLSFDAYYFFKQPQPC